MGAKLTPADRTRVDTNFFLQNTGSGNVIVTSIDSTHAGFKSLVAGANIAISNTSTEITIDFSPTSTINSQAGTSYTLLSTDNGKILVLTNAGTITLTVPTGLPIGFNCTIVQGGAGKAVFTASGTTITTADSFTRTKAAGAVAAIICIATNSFVTTGQMQA
jgi:hypothetical protein